ncbi:MAG: cytochrome c nitrite reductase small subunit [bacterium]
MIPKVAFNPSLLTSSLAVSAVGVLMGVSGYTFFYGGGPSYLSDAPEVCLNCHVMRESFDSWVVSSHHEISCNDCHLPHGKIQKYAAKVENGVRHSAAFTFLDVQVLHATAKTLRDIQENCIRCHEPMATFILHGEKGESISCARCHRRVGHVY